MVELASAFCIGVYFLGVGVVGSVLYIPISLMRAIEHYHIGGDGVRSKRNRLLDEGMLHSTRNSESPSLCDDGRSNSNVRGVPEILLIHKRKLLRDILNDSCHPSNSDLDEKSDNSSNCVNSDKFTPSVYDCDFDKRPLATKNLHSLVQNCGNFSKDVLSTTTPSEKDEDERMEFFGNVFSLEYFKQGEKKISDCDRFDTQKYLACSSTNSTSSILSSIETNTVKSFSRDVEVLDQPLKRENRIGLPPKDARRGHETRNSTQSLSKSRWFQFADGNGPSIYDDHIGVFDSIIVDISAVHDISA
ncbi:hypothetical protein HWI79_1412 [Cryptosporidium felis]|nr:hypothetical protein HWI79_1412 [Cryptosporidium felis]